MNLIFLLPYLMNFYNGSRVLRDFQEINYASCGVGNMSAPNLGRVGTPIPQENLECFFIWKSLKAY
jgi:hypothetical protein